jgi:hypothetical protein
MTPYEQIKRDHPEIPIDPLIDFAKRDKWIRNYRKKQRREIFRKIDFIVCVAFLTLVVAVSVAIMIIERS